MLKRTSWLTHLLDSWLHYFTGQRVINSNIKLLPPVIGIPASDHCIDQERIMPRTGDAHVRSLGMILSFFLMTPFMMSFLPLPLRYLDLEYFIIAFTVLGDEAVGVSPDACWSKLPSRKLYTS
jgi:hypothetical protein